MNMQSQKKPMEKMHLLFQVYTTTIQLLWLFFLPGLQQFLGRPPLSIFCEITKRNP